MDGRTVAELARLASRKVAWSDLVDAGARGPSLRLGNLRDGAVSWTTQQSSSMVLAVVDGLLFGFCCHVVAFDLAFVTRTSGTVTRVVGPMASVYRTRA